MKIPFISGNCKHQTHSPLKQTKGAYMDVLNLLWTQTVKKKKKQDSKRAWLAAFLLNPIQKNTAGQLKSGLREGQARVNKRILPGQPLSSGKTCSESNQRFSF